MAAEFLGRTQIPEASCRQRPAANVDGLPCQSQVRYDLITALDHKPIGGLITGLVQLQVEFGRCGTMEYGEQELVNRGVISRARRRESQTRRLRRRDAGSGW